MSNTVSREYIDQYGVTAEEYAKLTSEDQKALSASYVAELISEGLSPDEIETKLEELQDKINEVISEYQSELKELNSLENGDFTPETLDYQQKLEKQLDDLIAILEAEVDNIKAADDDFKKHRIALPNGGDVGALEPGTEPYVCDMSGSDSISENPLGDTTLAPLGDYQNSALYNVVSLEEYSYLLNQNIINKEGAVITGTGTFAEIDTALKTYEFTQDHTAVMMPTKNASGSPVTNITPLSSNGGTDSFSVEFADGTSLILTFINVPDNMMYYFNAGIDSAASLSGWPDDLLKQCTWGDGTSDVTDGLVTFYDSLHQTEYTDEQKRGVISGYTDVKEGYDSITKTYGTTSATAEGSVDSNKAQEAYSDAVDILYDYLNDPTAKDIDEVWDEVYDKFAELGLSPAEISAALQALVLSVQTNDPDHFSVLFQGNAVTRIEASLVASTSKTSSTNTLTALDKLTIMVLEQFGAPGNYADLLTGGYFSSDGTTDGKWADHDENVWALTQFNTICGNSTGGTLPEAVTFLDNEKEKAGITDTSGGGAKSAGYNSDQAKAIEDSINDYVKKYNSNELIDVDGTTEAEAESDLYDIIPNITDLWKSGAPIADIRDAILKSLDGLTDKANSDDVACLVMALLMDKAPTLFSQLFSSDTDGEKFRLAMGKIIFNGGDVPSMVDPFNISLGGDNPFNKELYNMFPDFALVIKK